MSFEHDLLEQLDMLHNLARRLTDTRHDAEDLLQDTCLAGWQAWARHGPLTTRAPGGPPFA